MLETIASHLDDIIAESTNFVAACYGCRAGGQMSEIRYQTWLSKTGRKKTTVAPKMKCLPPTSEAFEENVKRARLQVCILTAALHPKPPDLDSTQFGWSKDEFNKILMPVILPKGIEAVPASILEMIRFVCESEEPCSTARCGCSKEHIACSIFCKCNATVSCQNPLTIIARAVDDDD